MINHLAQQSSYTELNAIFDNLKNYAIYHFQTEEAIWKEYFKGDTWETAHKSGHQHFIEDVIKLKAEENVKSLDDVIANIVSFLTPWLAYHILDDDKRMAQAVLEIQKGKTLEKAKSLAIEQMSGATKVLIDTLMVMSDKLAQRTVQLTREIIQRQKLQEALDAANRAKSEFLANMSHEIRTPLNAIKFTDTGSVTLRTRKLEENNHSILLRFETKDTGIGINPDSVSRLFTAFEQADVSTTRTHGGTGLGLAINKRLAHLMGGDVGVESTLGVGSTFWLTARLKKAEIPLNQLNSISAKPAAEVLLRDYAGQLVLIVEDEPLNREIAQMILEDVGLTVEMAENGAEAVAKVASKSYRLILMDMQMPVMDGLEATRKIRQLPEGKDIPILAMTANAFVEDKRNCFESGMNDFIDKPVLPEKLLDTLLKWLSRRP